MCAIAAAGWCSRRKAGSRAFGDFLQMGDELLIGNFQIFQQPPFSAPLASEVGGLFGRLLCEGQAAGE